MNRQLREVLAVALAVLSPVSALSAQELSIVPVRPSGSVFRRPYRPAEVPPVRLTNSGRLRDLIRAGQLYLSLHDAIALALENNIDIEIARYTPVTLAWRLERSQAGGALPGVPSGASQTVAVTSGQGVLGSQAAAGVNVNTNNTGARGPANATVSQIGPVTQTLDPSISESTVFSHRTLPQANILQTVVVALVQDQRVYNASYQQGFLSGGNLTVTYKNQYLNENAPTDLLNPSVAPNLAVSFTQNLLQGFGAAVNARNITVAKANLRNSDLAFRTEVTRVLVNVSNVYFSLVASYEDLKSKQQALDVAGKFLEESRKRLDLGALAQLDITTARNQIATTQLALVNTQVAIRQYELQLKNLISRTGAADPLLAGVSITPTDHLAVPSDDLPVTKDLITQALANRSDLLSEQASLLNAETSALGTANGLLPTLQVFAGESQAGLAGTPRLVNGQTADPYFVGGIGTALGQIARRNFPTENVGAFARVSLKNRQAQADYAIEQLQLRQQQLITAKDRKQAEVDVLNAVVALRQARAHYDASVRSRTLQQELLDSEQKKFALGASTSYNVILQQRDLVAAQAAELQTQVSWQSARISLDQMTGASLEANHISIAESKAGRVAP